jgi:hypothetical protein
MTAWTVDKTREWAMEELYGLYMKDSQQWLHIHAPQDEEESETEPLGVDAIREMKQLVSWMWAETPMTEEYQGRIAVRLTPMGREAWEAYLKAKEKDPVNAVLHPAI